MPPAPGQPYPSGGGRGAEGLTARDQAAVLALDDVSYNPFCAMRSVPDESSGRSGKRTKYVCARCRLAAWAKPDAMLKCGACDLPTYG
jgi:hypothetical protein